MLFEESSTPIEIRRAEDGWRTYWVVNRSRPHIVAQGPWLTALLLMELTGTLQDGQLRLTWTPVTGVAGYWVYGAGNEPFFVPGFGPDYEHRLAVLPSWLRVYTSANGIGDPAANWTYLVMAIYEVEEEITRSNRVGEFDFQPDVP